MNYLSIYLAGNIQKSHENKSKVYWTKEDCEAIEKVLFPLRVSFLNPALRSDDLCDQKGVFGRDMVQVFCADVIFVDARERRGLGVGAEMMWAKINEIPVVTLAPRNSHYHKDEVEMLGQTLPNWVHPFVESLSDTLVETPAQGAEWILKLQNGEVGPIKGIQSIKEAMVHYKEASYKSDAPMVELSARNHDLRKKLSQLGSLL